MCVRGFVCVWLCADGCWLRVCVCLWVASVYGTLTKVRCLSWHACASRAMALSTSYTRAASTSIDTGTISFMFAAEATRQTPGWRGCWPLSRWRSQLTRSTLQQRASCHWRSCSGWTATRSTSCPECRRTSTFPHRRPLRWSPLCGRCCWWIALALRPMGRAAFAHCLTARAQHRMRCFQLNDMCACLRVPLALCTLVYLFLFLESGIHCVRKNMY